MSNHFGPGGQAWMVDVSGKTPTVRRARAAARVRLGPALAAAVAGGDLGKGDVLGVARLAGIAAVKRVPDLIPLTHPLAIHHAAVDLVVDAVAGVVDITCEVVACERTGVEMEALTGASVAALAVYDMCKGQDKGIVIDAVRLLHKSGGRSGAWDAPADAPAGKP